MRLLAAVGENKKRTTLVYLQSKEGIIYAGKLTIYDRKTNPIILKLRRQWPIVLLETLWNKKRSLKGIPFLKYMEKLPNGIKKME